MKKRSMCLQVTDFARLLVEAEPCWEHVFVGLVWRRNSRAIQKWSVWFVSYVRLFTVAKRDEICTSACRQRLERGREACQGMYGKGQQEDTGRVSR